MKTMIAAAVVFGLFARPGHAARPPANPACLAAAIGVLRVANAKVGSGAVLGSNQLRCAQFLSTTTVARPAHSEHI